MEEFEIHLRKMNRSAPAIFAMTCISLFLLIVLNSHVFYLQFLKEDN